MRKLTYFLFIFTIILAACSPKTYTEKDLAAVKLSQKDLPAEFVQSPDADIQNFIPLANSLSKAFFTTAATGKIINTTMFSKDGTDAAHGVVSFEYFPLSATEKQQVLTETKKQDIATCCKMLVNMLQGDETSCAQTDFTSTIKVVPGLDKIADGSLGCTLTITGDSYFELGYVINQNVISVIFEGFSQSSQDAKITPLLDLKTLLTLMNGKLSSGVK
jgi:hypothetical protein